MFEWFKPAAPTVEAVVPNFEKPLIEQVLALCEEPVTLGTLSDRLSLSYQEISPIVTELIAQGKLKTQFLPVGHLNCIHYARSNQRCNP